MITDAIRANLLEEQGYQVQVMEFIDMEHTPKNILIRAVRTDKHADNDNVIKKCEEFLHVSPTLGRLLNKGES